jgi:hypothetical protein
LVKTHLKSLFSDAVFNISNTGNTLSLADENYLRLILKHWCGWSATDTKHIHDSWVRYIQSEFSHLEGLVPILDTLVWPEELAKLPKGLGRSQCSLFLLATADSYFVYHFEDGALLRAGITLEEVYNGLKECRFHGHKEGDWEPEPMSLRSDWYRYFPRGG